MDRDKIRTLLNTLFLIGTVVCLILYFAVDDKHPFLYVCSASLFLKLVEIMLRVMR